MVAVVCGPARGPVRGDSRARTVRRPAVRRPLAGDALGRRVPGRARRARPRPGAAAARARRADREPGRAPRDGAVRAGAWPRGRARARRGARDPSREPRGPLRRSRAAAGRGPRRRRGRAGRRADAGRRGARVQLARRDRAFRRPPPDDPPAHTKGRSMTSPRCFGLLALLPAALGAQQPADTVTLKPVVVTATRLPTSPDALTAAVAVLPGDELRARGVTQVADALRGVPGAAVAQTGSFGGLEALFPGGGGRGLREGVGAGRALEQP